MIMGSVENESKTFKQTWHNIMELNSVLGQARFVTSKTKLDIWYNTFGERVSS